MIFIKYHDIIILLLLKKGMCNVTKIHYMRLFMYKYKKRIADKMLEKKLKGKGAVLIQGPK